MRFHVITLVFSSEVLPEQQNTLTPYYLFAEEVEVSLRETYGKQFIMVDILLGVKIYLSWRSA